MHPLCSEGQVKVSMWATAAIVFHLLVPGNVLQLLLMLSAEYDKRCSPSFFDLRYFKYFNQKKL